MGPIGWAESSHGWIDVDGKQITLTPWQRACLQAWEAHSAEISTLAVSNVKKTGKTLLNAILLCWRWLSLPSEHFAVGNDLDQSAGRQFQMIADMVRRNAYLRRNVKASANRLIFTPTGSTITALAVDAAGNAGANHLTASHTEAWGIVYEAGIRAFEELTPPPGKVYGLPALRIADSYAGYESESSVWHGIVDRGLAGQRIDPDWPIYLAGGLLLFHTEGEEAQRLCFRGTPEEAAAYYADQRSTLRPGAFLRLHENRRATGSESFINLEWWDRCVDANHRPMLGGAPDALYIGVDGSIKHDSAAVVACYFDRLVGKVVLARHRIWYPGGDTLDLDSTIGDFLRELRRAYSLSEIRFDPWQMVNLAQQLQREGLPMIEYPQTVGNLTAMGQNLYDLIKSGNLIAYADDDLRRQISHAVAVESSRGWKIAKDKASLKIDVVVALAIAALAAVERGNSIERFLPSMALWDACQEALPPLTPNEQMIMALYAGVGNDRFGLVGVTAHPSRPGYCAVRLVHEWRAQRGSMLDFYGSAEHPGPERLIRDVILPRYNVAEILYDARQLSELCSRLIAAGLVWCQPIDRLTDRGEAKYLLDAIISRRIVHDGNTALWQSLDNADRHIDQNGQKLSLEERTGSQPIDLAKCLSACVLTARDSGLCSY